MQAQEVVCGIDFGTTNSAIALLINQEIVSVGASLENGKTMPSLIFFSDSGSVSVGKQALQMYLTTRGGGRLIQSFKSFLSDPTFTSTIVGGKTYRLEDFVSFVVKELKKDAEDLVGITLDTVILGRPACFSIDEKKDKIAETRLIESAKMSGFKNVNIQIEPIAAAFDYEYNLEKEEVVLVADFGGGTSDFTIMRLSKERRKNKDRKNDIIGTSGVNIAGDAFNSVIMWEKLAKHFGRGAEYESTSGKVMEVPTALLWHLREWHKLPFLNNPRDKGLINRLLMTCTNKLAIQRFKQVLDCHLGFNLFQVVDQAKRNLSKSKETEIIFTSDYFMIKETLDHGELGMMIDRELSQINDVVSELLDITGMSENDIDTVFLTGGSSHLPQLQNMFEQRFGEQKIKRQGYGFMNVANGLALSSCYL
ncbi:MAG: Hsp70 family protein [bacterium]|nr:Hsp70 family protein [bacterium]